MTGIIPVDEEEEQEVYDDVGAIDEDIYEELPGLSTHFITVALYCPTEHEEKIACISLKLFFFFNSKGLFSAYFPVH